MSNNTIFRDKVSMLMNAGVGVTLVRSKESYKAMESIQRQSLQKGNKYHQWDVVNGWRSYERSHFLKGGNLSEVSGDSVVDPMKAFKKIEEIIESNKEKDDGELNIFTMHALHPWMSGKIPAITEWLRQAVRDYATREDVRLIIVVPEIFSLKDELKNDIPCVELDRPDAEEMRAILNYICDSFLEDAEASDSEGDSVNKFFSESQVDEVVANALGLTQIEAENAFMIGFLKQESSEGEVSELDFPKFLSVISEAKYEIIKQSECLELMKGVPMAQIGGLENFKEWLKEASPCFSKEAREFGVDAPKGCVLVGPSGSGKSILSKAVSSEMNLPLIRFDISRVFGSLVGESEGKVASAIKMIESCAPCVVMVDEIDKALGGSHSGGGDSGVTKRVLGAILTAMQESEKDIFWIASANRTEGLPPELMRKGRFDEIFAVLCPHSEERKQIFEIHLSKRNQSIADIEDMGIAIEASKGFVGAEIESIVNEAVKTAFVKKVPVTGALLVEKLESTKPQSVAFKDQFDAMTEWASTNARPASALKEEAVPDGDAEVVKPRRKPRVSS